MFEPLVQDYIRACSELDREAFCRQVGAPVLISRATKEEQTFQLASTEMHHTGTKEKAQEARGLAQGMAQRRPLGHQLPVLELRKSTPGPTSQIGVGRAEENDVVIHDETVSSRHAVIFWDARTGVSMLQDLESTNGTRINGNLVVPGRAIELRDGDELSFGDAAYIFFTPWGLYDELKRMMAPVMG